MRSIIDLLQTATMDEKASMRVRACREDAKGPLRRRHKQVDMSKTPTVVLGASAWIVRKPNRTAESLTNLQGRKPRLENRPDSKKTKPVEIRKKAREANDVFEYL